MYIYRTIRNLRLNLAYQGKGKYIDHSQTVKNVSSSIINQFQGQNEIV